MTQAEYAAFVEQITRLARVFRPPSPVDAILDEYWRALQHLDLHEFVGRVDHWTSEQEKFPRPVDLKYGRAHETARPLYHYPLASPADLQEYRAAERANWWGEVCGCRECCEAGVAEQRRRYVPIDGAAARRCPDASRQTYLTRGEWIHGWALARWIRARDAFRAAFTQVRPHVIAGEREPGCDDE